ncbi:MAG: hypothetical protein MR902_04105, partial [Campylobacter sp.]|nr:hypothetical protein [Campylobacter sp.]
MWINIETTPNFVFSGFTQISALSSHTLDFVRAFHSFSKEMSDFVRAFHSFSKEMSDFVRAFHSF